MTSDVYCAPDIVYQKKIITGFKFKKLPTEYDDRTMKQKCTTTQQTFSEIVKPLPIQKLVLIHGSLSCVLIIEICTVLPSANSLQRGTSAPQNFNATNADLYCPMRCLPLKVTTYKCSMSAKCNKNNLSWQGGFP